MLFGERLQQSRNNLNLTQQDIANEMHVSRQTISSWERGNSYPDINSLVSLSDYYQVSLDVLLKEDTGMKEYLEKKQVERSIKPTIMTLFIVDLLFLLLITLQRFSIIQFNSQAEIILITFGIFNAVGLLQLTSFQIKIKNQKKKGPFMLKRNWILLTTGLLLLLVGVLAFIFTSKWYLGGIISGVGFGLLFLAFSIKTSPKI